MVFPPITSPFYFSFSTLFLFFFTLPAFLCIPAKEKRLYWKNGPKRKDRRQLYNFKYIFLSILIFLFFFIFYFHCRLYWKKREEKRMKKLRNKEVFFYLLLKYLLKYDVGGIKVSRKRKKQMQKNFSFSKTLRIRRIC